MWKNDKNKIIVLFSMLIPFSSSYAMQALDDLSLSDTTGQDGINVAMHIPQVDVSQVALIDKDGISAKILNKDYSKGASLTVAGTNNSPIHLGFVGDNTGSTLNAVLDTDAGNGKAFANMAISLGSGITGIKVSPFAVYLSSTNGVNGLGNAKDVFNSTGTLSAGVTKFLEIGSTSQNFQIDFVNNNAPKVNVQLGNVPQSQMVLFSGAIQSICGTGSGCPISVISGDTAAKFDFQMKASDASNGFILNGFYAGVEPSGFVLGNTGTSSKVNVALNNVTLGNSGLTSANIFNGIPNGSMGSFGVIGASVKDLKVSIKGF